MIEFVKAGGFLMLPILICSIIALAIVIQRFITLRNANIIPENVISHAKKLIATGTPASKSDIKAIDKSSLIGPVLAAGLENANQPRHIMKESLEESGRHATHKMNKYMTTLGTIATITPLLGLLGTVVGMIDVFSVITRMGVGSPGDLAGGISTALITTAAGISVAVPSMIFHRFFKGKINDYSMRMEQEAQKLVDLANSNRAAYGTTPPRPAAQGQAPQRRPAPQNPAALKKKVGDKT